MAPSAFPARTVAEFIAHAKANKGKLNMGSGGQGSATHIFGELFKTMAGVDLLHVPCRGPYMPDLISGQLQLIVAPIPQALPDVPTVAETVPGYEAIGWYGLGVPKGVPTDIVVKINAATNDSLADAKLRERLASLGVEAMPMSPEAFGKFVENEAVKWTKVIRDAGAVAE